MSDCSENKPIGNVIRYRNRNRNRDRNRNLQSQSEIYSMLKTDPDADSDSDPEQIVGSLRIFINLRVGQERMRGYAAKPETHHQALGLIRAGVLPGWLTQNQAVGLIN